MYFLVKARDILIRTVDLSSYFQEIIDSFFLLSGSGVNSMVPGCFPGNDYEREDQYQCNETSPYLEEITQLRGTRFIQ